MDKSNYDDSFVFFSLVLLMHTNYRTKVLDLSFMSENQ